MQIRRHLASWVADRAAPNIVEFRTGSQRWRPEFRSKLEKQILQAGDGVDMKSPGGGGFGKPFEREVEAVETDLNIGYISRRTAEEDYGAVIAEVRAFGRPGALPARPRGDRAAPSRSRRRS